MRPVTQLLWFMCLAITAAVMSDITFRAPLAADTESAAPGNQDMERRACLEAIDNPVGEQAPAKATNDERSKIINRCLAQAGEFGTAVVRACAEQDLASYEALLAYPEACAPFVVRCAKRVGQHSWGMVKICVDRDIGAEQGSEN